MIQLLIQGMLSLCNLSILNLSTEVMKKSTIKKIKLKEVTWVLGDKPCKTLKMSTGCYANITKK
jgi:hypothetical protein